MAEFDSTKPVTSPAGVSVAGSPSLAEVSPERYQIESEIARGGRGRILSARDRRHERRVAIKELLPGSEGTRRRFEREALVTARLQHPSIVAVYEAGKWPDGEPFYAMKFVEGRPLHKVIATAGGRDERLALLPH